jgi:hypothetical protein
MTLPEHTGLAAYTPGLRAVVVALGVPLTVMGFAAAAVAHGIGFAGLIAGSTLIEGVLARH